MRKCPVCEFHNLDDRETCLKCNAVLAHSPRVAAETRRPPRLNWFAPLLRYASKLRRRIARAFEVPLPENVPHRFPFLAAFLGLAPGLGQLYNHQPKKILYFIPAFAGSLASAVYFITTPYVGNIFIACTISVMMASFTDALLTAARINGQYFTLRNTLAALTYPFFLLGFFGFLCAVMAFLQWPLFTLFYAGHDYMRPAINRRDRICGEGFTYLFRSPRPGDVVRYDPPKLVVELPNPDPLDGDPRGIRWEINPQNGWERVMAVEGETLECRDREYYVDGKRLSPEYYPLLNDQIWPNFKITCSPGKILVLMTSRPEGADFINLLRNMTGDRAERYEGENKYRMPESRYPGVIIQGWEDACLVDKKAVLDRAWFRYHPSARRLFFQSRGPRFLEAPEALTE